MARGASGDWPVHGLCRHEKDEFDTLHWVIVIASIALVIAGLIEFNARRQAAAMTRELLRPMTAQEQRQFDAGMHQLEKSLTRATPPARPKYDERPLWPDERCIQHQRFMRLENGWKQVGTCQ